jgi:arsenate reductase
VTRVLFVCIGNSCRSQMAEGFARTYGSDVMIPASAGLAPASSVARDTVRVMAEKNIDVSEHFPKALQHLSRVSFELVVNMSCRLLPPVAAPVLEWAVDDPIGTSLENYRTVRDEIEARVMKLITELRRGQTAAR